MDLQLCRKLNRQREAAEANKTHTDNLTITFSNNTHTDTHGQAGRQSSGPETYQTLIHSLSHTQSAAAAACFGGGSHRQCVCCWHVCVWFLHMRMILRSTTLTRTTMKSQMETRQNVSVKLCMCVCGLEPKIYLIKIKISRIAVVAI